MDPWESNIQELMHEHYTREEICMALIMTSPDNTEKVFK